MNFTYTDNDNRKYGGFTLFYSFEKVFIKKNMIQNNEIFIEIRILFIEGKPYII